VAECSPLAPSHVLGCSFGHPQGFVGTEKHPHGFPFIKLSVTFTKHCDFIDSLQQSRVQTDLHPSSQLFDRDARTLCPHAGYTVECVLSPGCHDNSH
jgi:hypothetical protein